MNTISSEKEHLRHGILFAFQLKKNTVQVAEMICSTLDEDAVIRLVKSGFKGSRKAILILLIENAVECRKK